MHKTDRQTRFHDRNSFGLTFNSLQSESFCGFSNLAKPSLSYATPASRIDVAFAFRAEIISMPFAKPNDKSKNREGETIILPGKIFFEAFESGLFSNRSYLP